MRWFWKTWAIRTPEGVSLSLRLPRSWKREHDAPAALALKNERDGSMFLITPCRREVSRGLRGKLRDAVAAEAERNIPQSVGDQVEMFGIAGENAEGCYFIASDRNVKPGEWAHKISGLVEIDGLVISFTVLSHQPPRMGEGDALRAFEYLVVRNA